MIDLGLFRNVNNTNILKLAQMHNMLQERHIYGVYSGLFVLNIELCLENNSDLYEDDFDV